MREIASLPGPRRWPLVGNVLQINQREVHLDFEGWARQYGKTFRVYFGRRPVLVIAGHKEVAGVLRERPETFRRPTISFKVSQEMNPDVGVFIAEGDEWRNQRRMVMAGFAPGPIRAYLPTLKTVAARLQARWERASLAGESIDLASDLKRYTVDIIAGLAFGSDVNTLESGEDVIQKHLDQILPAIARRSLSLFPYWRYFKLPQDRQLDKSLAFVRTAIQELIAQARQRLTENPERKLRPQNLLEAMLIAADSPDSGVTDSAVAGNVSTMLLAGEDTTANTIAWVLYLLYKNPNMLAKAREEVNALLTSTLDLSQLDSLIYMDACIQEAMRLKPVGPFMPLEAVKGTVVDNVRVPAKTIVWCLFRHDTMSSENFAEPEVFNPDRWISSEGQPTIDKKISMPFGSGPRMCPGRYLALLEIKIALAMVLTRFKIEGVNTPDGRDAKELMAFVMSPVGLRLKLKALTNPIND